MDKFLRVKEICTYISQLNALNFSQHSGLECATDLRVEFNPIKGREKEIEYTIQNRGLSAAYGPVRSGAEINGKWIDFIALNQVITSDARKLKKLLNEISNNFWIELDGNSSLNVIGRYKEGHADLVHSASYFIAAKKVYAINLTDQNLITLVGEQLGYANKSEEGAVVELNVENTPDLKTIIHELVHLKWPESVNQSEYLVDKIEKKVSHEMKKLVFPEIFNNVEIQKERAEALNAFKLLDNDFMKFLNH